MKRYGVERLLLDERVKRRERRRRSPMEQERREIQIILCLGSFHCVAYLRQARKVQVRGPMYKGADLKIQYLYLKSKPVPCSEK
jgi:hypothetical protein